MNVPMITAFVGNIVFFYSTFYPIELTLLAIILYYTGVVNAHTCSITINKNNIFANCSHRNLQINVPQDLNPDVTEIDLSGNTMVNLGYNHGFDRYPQLRILIMKDMTKGSPFSKTPYLFRNAYSLEIIDFTRAFVEDAKLDFVWPPNIRIIYCAENPLYRNLEIDHLKKLEKIFASGITELEGFPKFHELASVSLIDIKNTPVYVSTEIISNFCYLEHLNFTPSANLSYCECRKIRLWMITYRIKSGTPFACGKSEDGSKCDLKFTSKEIEQRRNCFGKGMSMQTTNRWWIVLAMLLVILLSLLIPSYVYVKKFRDVKHKQHHPKSSRLSSAPDSAPDEEVADEDDSQTESG